MARSGPAVAPPLILPDAPERYDVQNERETRRLIKENANAKQTTDFGTLVTVPPPVSALATVAGAAADTIAYFTSATAMAVTSFTAFARSLLAAATATAARVVLNIVEHRSSTIKTTASLAVGATETGTITMPDTVCRLLTIKADRACWVRFYTDAASRTTDSARTFGTLPTAGTGVLAEFVYTTAMTFPFTIPTSPVPILANNDGTPAATVYYAITNKSAASSTVQVTLGFGALP